jgi:hypothetical protein
MAKNMIHGFSAVLETFLNAKRMKNMILRLKIVFVLRDIIKLMVSVQNVKRMKFLNLNLRYVGLYVD